MTVTIQCHHDNNHYALRTATFEMCAQAITQLSDWWDRHPEASGHVTISIDPIVSGASSPAEPGQDQDDIMLTFPSEDI